MRTNLPDRSHDLIGSWIIVSRETGEPVCELYDENNVKRVNIEKYIIYTAQEWLGKLNKLTRG